MGQIMVLDDHIANQIAAGEVVERPASVIKELVENAVDAGSTRIEVTVEEGGLSFIRVADNGSGIAHDDLRTAFQRHATSKIRTGRDLFHIRTLGFRGEALPSIAAVAKVECVTSDSGSGLGRRLVIEGGEVKAEEDTAAPQGTEFTVRELFYNTPARLKYMKTVQTELSHISDYIYRMALAHPGISFTLSHNGNVLLQTAGRGDLLQAVAAIYGTSCAKTMLSVQGESPDFTVAGFVSKPELTRANRYGMSFFVNGRYIRHYGLQQALLQSYHTLLPVGRYPLSVLHIDMDPSLVDVNVHPSKLEVRFSKEAELSETLQAAVKSALGREQLIPRAQQPKARGEEKPKAVQEQLELYRSASPARAPLTGAFGGGPASAPGLAARPAQSAAELPRLAPAAPKSFTRSPDLPQRHLPSPIPETRIREWLSPPPEDAPPPAKVPDVYASGDGDAAQAADLAYGAGAASADAPPFGEGALPQQRSKLPPAAEDAAASEPDAKRKLPSLMPVGHLHGTYIIAQSEDGMYIIDQHAAHERVNYEYYVAKFARPEPVSQELLLPIALELTPSDAALLKGRLELLEEAGVALEPFGGNGFLVRAYPEWLPSGEEKIIIEEMIDWVLASRTAPDIGKLREKAAILCSCKASIKANQKQSLLEAEALLSSLSQCEQPFTCPHGRPIIVHFSTYELEKMFKRVM
ncbi:DNA mismatch repair endonuclease MutL [Paenibacillus turpanensis]|uniref:DNA mismatch repair endonuclease MutL n=1 Tax=Paenibacillus turpanensis TaxID=2689078 RepID=UPI00140B0FD4|nr:DNA mismatch repair endonuclease MutL [Paenibacillus turpanensis]